jgi:hypothetical protein
VISDTNCYQDEHCIELVEKYNLSKLLLDLYQSTENATFQYAILGCLKHLCLPISNKDIIGSDNCIGILSPALEESKDMLKRNQFLTVGIIKLLCTGNCKYFDFIAALLAKVLTCYYR